MESQEKATLFNGKPIESALKKSQELRRRNKIEYSKERYLRSLIYELGCFLNIKILFSDAEICKKFLTQYSKDEILATADMVVEEAKKKGVFAFLFLSNWHYHSAIRQHHKQLVKEGIDPRQLLSDFLDQCSSN